MIARERERESDWEAPEHERVRKSRGYSVQRNSGREDGAAQERRESKLVRQRKADGRERK